MLLRELAAFGRVGSRDHAAGVRAMTECGATGRTDRLVDTRSGSERQHVWLAIMVAPEAGTPLLALVIVCGGRTTRSRRAIRSRAGDFNVRVEEILGVVRAAICRTAACADDAYRRRLCAVRGPDRGQFRPVPVTGRCRRPSAGKDRAVIEPYPRGIAWLRCCQESRATEPEIADVYRAIEPASLRGEVRFEGVVYSYDTSRPTLAGIDLCVPPGETVAFVDTSGAGETTPLALLPRFF